MFRTTWLLPCLALGCGGDGVKHDCDAGTPTCESSLVVLMPDNRTEFVVSVSDGVGLAVDVQCPEPDTGLGNVVEGYVVTCGGGRVTFETSAFFGDEVTVGLEQLPDRTFTVDSQKGGDFCGNPCTIGTVQL